jgi:phosphoribosyl 1,2-cyclic phosphodiesterase
MTIRFWGVRGSVPTPGRDTARYGGNTPCVEIAAGEERFIFDVGTGVRELGAAATGPIFANIFLTHYHYDHLQGLPFFETVVRLEDPIRVRGPDPR